MVRTATAKLREAKWQDCNKQQYTKYVIQPKVGKILYKTSD